MDLDVIVKNKVMFEQKIAQAMSKMQIPGLAIAMVKDNKVIYHRGFGTKDLERNVPIKHPITPDTKLEIGSCTKSFTALAFKQWDKLPRNDEFGISASLKIKRESLVLNP